MITWLVLRNATHHHYINCVCAAQCLPLLQSSVHSNRINRRKTYWYLTILKLSGGICASFPPCICTHIHVRECGCVHKGTCPWSLPYGLLQLIHWPSKSWPMANTPFLLRHCKRTIETYGILNHQHLLSGRVNAAEDAGDRLGAGYLSCQRHPGSYLRLGISGAANSQFVSLSLHKDTHIQTHLHTHLLTRA